MTAHTLFNQGDYDQIDVQAGLDIVGATNIRYLCGGDGILDIVEFGEPWIAVAFDTQRPIPERDILRTIAGVAKIHAADRALTGE